MDERIRVLYVDDNVLASRVHAEMLVDHGFDVLTAATPGDGLETLASGEVDCILSDLEMPDTDGFEFLTTIRADHPRLPFILFTWDETERAVIEAFERGATDFIPKSFCAISYELLVRRIEQAVT